MHFNPKEEWASTQEGRQKLVKALMNNSLGASVGIGTVDPAELPRRYLPPGSFGLGLVILCIFNYFYVLFCFPSFCITWLLQWFCLLFAFTRSYSDLFRVYQAEAFAKGQPAASPSTFFRTLRSSGWRQKLKFRHVSNHAQCQICQRLKSGIKHATTIQRHAACADAYMRHLSGVFSDRQVYQQYKWRAMNQRDIVCVMIDSMDKSKFRLPRFPYGRCPKSLETRKRPELGVTAAICHGRGVWVYVSDEDAAGGSDWSLEVLSLTLNKAFTVAQQSNEPWPSHLRVWSDNTPKDHGCQQFFKLFGFGFHPVSKGVSQFHSGALLLPFGNHEGFHKCGPWPFGRGPHSWRCRFLGDQFHQVLFNFFIWSWSNA